MGLGLCFFSLGFFIISGELELRNLLVVILVSIWGVRLAWHINKRHKGKPEDYRYAVWRKEWGKWFIYRSYLQVFLFARRAFIYGCITYTYY